MAPQSYIYSLFCLTGYFPGPNQQTLKRFEDKISKEEISRALKSMGGFKAPGPDGLQAIFYQTQWNIVGPTVCQLVDEIERDPARVATINKTLITLIPKMEHVTSLKNMRPISLCNVSYKILTKVLA